MFDLKLLTPEAIPRALEKAERYRLLGDPAEAESICEDVLRIEPDNQQALVALLLALTEQFDDGVGGHVAAARDILPRLHDEYDRAYFGGIVLERQAKSRLRARGTAMLLSVRACLVEAMEQYEKAEALRAPGNDDALLRWNACARVLMRHGMPAPEERFEPMLE